MELSCKELQNSIWLQSESLMDDQVVRPYPPNNLADLDGTEAIMTVEHFSVDGDEIEGEAIRESRKLSQKALHASN